MVSHGNKELAIIKETIKQIFKGRKSKTTGNAIK